MSEYFQTLATGFIVLSPIIPLLAVIFLGIFFWDTYKDYAQAKFDAKNKKILLEIKLPRDVLKSPRAMELVLVSMFITSREGTWIDRLIKGQFRPRFSLEVVSLGGKVHFYIWTEEGFKDIIEAQLYAQFPNIEVHLVNDYTKGIIFDGKNVDMFAAEFVKDGTSPIPIKTYVDYGLDDDPKDEFKIDPMTAMLEFLGSLKPDEQFWMQIIIRAHKKQSITYTEKVKQSDGSMKEVTKVKVDTWKHDAEVEKKKILDRSVDKETGRFRFMTKSETDLVAAIDRNISKLAFDCGIRTIILAPKIRGALRSGMMGSLRQYSDNSMNSFKPTFVPSYDYPWQDFLKKSTTKQKKELLHYYKLRAFFGLGSGKTERKHCVMSTEELATLFHLPGSVVMTPNLERIMSRKGDAPANLPL